MHAEQASCTMLRTTQRIKWLAKLLVLFTLLALPACQEGIYTGTLIFSGSQRLERGENLPGDVFVRAGAAEFGAGSRVQGTLTVLGGEVTLDGEVGGDVVLLGGRLILGSEAHIAGDLRLGGGEAVGVETAVIDGATISSGGLALPETGSRARTWQDWLRLLSAVLLLALSGAWLARNHPRPLGIVGDTIVQNPLASTAVGLLWLLVLPAVLVMMAFTIVLIPLVIAGVIFLLLLWAYGIVAAARQLGEWLAQHFGRPLGAPAAAFWGTLLLFALFLIPFLGTGLLVLVSVLALGAVSLTRVGTRPFVSAAAEQPAADSADYRRPDREWH